MKESVLKLMPKRVYLKLRWLDYKLSRKEDFNKLQKQRTVVSETNHSFKGFDDTKSIFIHIPKCAGVSVSEALYGNLAGGHTTLEEYLGVFEPKNIESYFKFTFTRNPWDRLVSAYYFLKKGGWGEQDILFFEKELQNYSSFEDFVLNWVNENNIWKYHHVFRPQSHYILDKRNKVKLDFVGRLENIDNDFRYICNKLNLECQLPHSNKSQHKDYRQYYNAETANIISEVYAKDISLLKYEF